MRKFLATTLCVLISGLPALAQSAGQNPQAPAPAQSSQNNSQAQAAQQGTVQTPSPAQDPDEPVLKRRTPEERAGEPPQSQPNSQSNGPVLQSRQPPPTTIPMAGPSR